MHFCCTGITAKLDCHWARRFFERHPDLCLKKKIGKNVKNERKFDQERAQKFVKLLDSLHTRGYFTIPCRIANLDETGFKLGYGDSVVIVRKGTKQAEWFSQKIHVCLVLSFRVLLILWDTWRGSPCVAFVSVKNFGGYYSITECYLFKLAPCFL